MASLSSKGKSKLSAKQKLSPTKKPKPASDFLVSNSAPGSPSLSQAVTPSVPAPAVPQVAATEVGEEASLLATIATLERRTSLDSDVAGSEETLKRLLQQQSELDTLEALEKAKAASLQEAALAEKRASDEKIAAAAELEKVARLAALKSKITSLQESLSKRHKGVEKEDKPGDNTDPQTSKPGFKLPLVMGSDLSSSVPPRTEHKDTGVVTPPVITPPVIPFVCPPGHLMLPMGHHSLANLPFPVNTGIFVKSLATPEDIKSLANLASHSDYGAAAAAFTAIELFQGLLQHATSTHPVTVARSSKIRSSSIIPKETVSEEIALTKLISTASCQNLVLRIMMNPRAMLSLNCFLPSNRAHFNWVEEITNGQKKPFLQPFPASLTGRELLSILHQFTLLVTVVDAFLGVSLSLLYKVVEDLLLAGELPLVAAKYIEEIRQNVFTSDDTSLMWSLQDHILSLVKSTLPATTTPTQKAKPTTVIDTVKDLGKPDIHARPSGTESQRRPFGRNGYQLDSVPNHPNSAVNKPAILYRNPQGDPNKRYLSCDTFNSPSGCSHSAADCRYNHICCLCADPNHGITGHGRGLLATPKAAFVDPNTKLLENAKI